jgi:hypothetical protein
MITYLLRNKFPKDVEPSVIWYCLALEILLESPFVFDVLIRIWKAFQ